MPEMNDSLPAELRNLNPEDVMMGRALPPQILLDLLRISALSTERLDFIATTCSKEQLVAPKEIEIQLKSELGEDLAKSVTRTVFNFEPASVARMLHILERMRQSNPKASETFTDAIFDSLKSNLAELTKDRPAVALIRKSQRLQRATGNEIESALFVCDLRPVFDKSYEKVEGLISVANLKIDFKDQNNQDGCIEFAVSGGDLEYLIKRCEDAKKKMEVLTRDYLGNADSGGAHE